MKLFKQIKQYFKYYKVLKEAQAQWENDKRYLFMNQHSKQVTDIWINEVFRSATNLRRLVRIKQGLKPFN